MKHSHNHTSRSDDISEVLEDLGFVWPEIETLISRVTPGCAFSGIFTGYARASVA